MIIPGEAERQVCAPTYAAFFRGIVDIIAVQMLHTSKLVRERETDVCAGTKRKMQNRRLKLECRESSRFHLNLTVLF